MQDQEQHTLAGARNRRNLLCRAKEFCTLNFLKLDATRLTMTTPCKANEKSEKVTEATTDDKPKPRRIIRRRRRKENEVPPVDPVIL